MLPVLETIDDPLTSGRSDLGNSLLQAGTAWAEGHCASSQQKPVQVNRDRSLYRIPIHTEPPLLDRRYRLDISAI